MMLPIGEVVLIRVLFRHGVGGKVRPAVVVLNTGDDDFVAAPVTSQARVSDFDLALEDWQGAGLNVASYVRVHKLAVLAKAEVVRRIGSLVERDVESMQALLCRAYCRDGSTE